MATKDTEKKGTFLAKIKKYLNYRLLLGLLVGAAGGYAYYYFVGCQSGSCPITSNPLTMTLYGMAFGGVLFVGETKKNQEEPKG